MQTLTFMKCSQGDQSMELCPIIFYVSRIWFSLFHLLMDDKVTEND